MGFFLTYPKCPLHPEEALERLRLCHSTAIKDYCVAQEKHQDGSFHLHAFLRYESKITFDLVKNPRIFDIDGYHGNYAPAKSYKNVLAYCQKGGVYVSSFGVDEAKSKKAARNVQLLNQQPNQLIDDGTIGLFQLPSLIKAKEAYHCILPAYRHHDVRGIWVTGLSGAGKSHFVRHRHPADTLYIKSASNRWFCGYTGQHHILIDDFDHNHLASSSYLKIWADRWECSAETKGGKVNLHHRIIYVTSQYTIDDLWHGNEHEELRDALNRRFQKIHISRDNQLREDDLEHVDN